MSIPLLVVAGSPRLPVDAIRYMQVAVSGTTAARVAAGCQERGVEVHAVVAEDSSAALQNVLPAERCHLWQTRDELDAAMQRWLTKHPAGTVFLSAAINDYNVATLRWQDADGQLHEVPAGSGKVPSRAEWVDIRLRQARKLIADLPSWGHSGRLVACKYSPADTVLAQAKALQAANQADLVLANSLDGAVQALVGDAAVDHFDDRAAILASLVDRIAMWNLSN